MRTTIIVLALAFGGTCWMAAASAGLRPWVAMASAARAEGGWRGQLDELCSRTQDAMALSSDELRSLIACCDKLAPALEKLEESERKIFTRRLKACRDLYQFVLDAREKA